MISRGAVFTHFVLLTTLQMWDVIKDVLLPAHEVKEHTKAVSCFAVSEPSDKLISGSADKTVRVRSCFVAC